MWGTRIRGTLKEIQGSAVERSVVVLVFTQTLSPGHIPKDSAGAKARPLQGPKPKVFGVFEGTTEVVT